MNGRFVLGVLLALVLIAGALGVGVYAYNAGVAQGMLTSGKDVAPSIGVAPVPYYYRAFGFHPFGFLSCLFPLLFFFLFFGLLRAFLWRGHWGKHWHGERGVPPMFDEWHRKMHEPPTTEK